MKALLLTDYRQLSIVDTPMPEVGDEDVLVRVRACGICGSDVHGYDGSTGRRIPPLVMGHEAAGAIEAVGRGVREFTPGDRVTFDSTVSCGDCAFCRAGRTNLCDRRTIFGVSCGDFRRHGAFAEFVSVPARILYRLPEQLPFEHAALIEALSVAVHAVGLHPPAPSDTLVVIGCGMIGLLVIQVLRDRGCQSIIAVDLDPSRRRMATELGASAALDGGVPDVGAEIRALTGGRGVDQAFEAVGITATVTAAIRSVRKGGTVTIIGNLLPVVQIPVQEVVTRELSLLGSCSSSGEYPQSINLLARGAVTVAPLVSAVAPLEEGPRWFNRLHAGASDVMKVVLVP